MGHRSWIVETDKEHYDTTKQISTEYGSFDIVGAAVVKESLKDIEKGTYFEPNDIVLLLHSSGNHVIKEHPEVFGREFCLLDDIHYLRTDNGGTVAELEYLKEKEFLELIDPK